jgi:hypothetical protein
MGYRTEFLRYPLCNYAVHVRGFGYWDIDFLRLELHSATEELFKAMANRPNDGDPQESLGPESLPTPALSPRQACDDTRSCGSQPAYGSLSDCR